MKLRTQYQKVLTVKSSVQYIPFARKYRPSNFFELQGQEILVKILSHTILNNRLAQGYLLTGIRGVGKTSSARIIAKTVNCTALITEGINIRTCELCSNCISFNNHNHPDIIEIDAASRTSVEDIRKVIESAEYKPLLSQYKIFIIDEVHMLSKGAFNALLKTLEEPPPHIIFIFATTEAQKIPSTIISRCQRYDLRRLTFEEIFNLLTFISDKESLKVEPAALKIIAAKSDGSARDAVSILDQAAGMSAKSDGLITCQMINQILGLVDIAVIIEFFNYVINRDVTSAIALVDKLYMSSANLEIFIESVADFIAYLNKVKMLPNYSLPIYESFSEIKDILAKISFLRLSVLWQIYSKAIQEVKISYNQLTETEMLVIKSIYSQSLPSMEELASVSTPVSTQVPQVKEDYKIIDFLKYLHQSNEMEIYYLLLNEVEIKSFANNKLRIVGPNITSKAKQQISELLFSWSKEKFEVLVTKQLEIQNLKSQLTNKIEASKDLELIKKHFPSSIISDILLKN
ncbi:DNA polymerase III subunit gamma/tau [Rickettsia endosymbiont of Polydrusus tereticollis]|uniref:DNA polymerase III subunit gamma/tau n=1 Tax=Rickettsia endosymbiont of Polydrusus tereticollis TaxID=3066251 RepID=UPI0031329BA4